MAAEGRLFKLLSLTDGCLEGSRSGPGYQKAQNPRGELRVRPPHFAVIKTVDLQWVPLK